MELLRFSVWKKELIEKQQTLYKLLKQHNLKESLEFSDGEILNEATESEDEDEYSIPDDISSDELNDIQNRNDDNDHDEEEEDVVEEEELGESSEEEDEPDETQLTSEHEPDSDFEISIHHRRHQNRNLISDLDSPPKKKKDLRCKVCNTTFLARQGLVRHEAFCRPNKLAGRKVPSAKKPKNIINKDAKFRCFCNDRFISFRALNIHRTRKHGKNTNMSWDIVDNDQNDNDNVKSTLSLLKLGSNSKSSDNSRVKSSQSKKIDQSFKCNQCPYRTDDRNSLKHHMKSNHEEVNDKILSKLECDECFKLFSTTTALRMHVVTVHHDVRP
jgi:hypothetical protein